MAETSLPSAAPPSRSWNTREARAIIYQVLTVAIIFVVGWWLVSNLLDNYARRGIKTGFGFLDLKSDIPIGESLIEWKEDMTFRRAILVAFLNTLEVSAIGVVLATILGIVIGVMALSKNWLIAKLTAGYLHAIRNIPLIVQIIVWYNLILVYLPSGDRDGPQIWRIPPGIFISNRGIDMPWPAWAPGWTAALAALAVAAIGAWGIAKWARRRQMATGVGFPSFWVGSALIVALPVIGWAVAGAPTEFRVPELLVRFGRQRIEGGTNISPEFLGLLIGLVVYTSAFIAEIVRSGILAVPKGQIEAARALGLREGAILRRVTLPQAMRVIIPPLTSQYLNLTKNSSLAAAIGFPDLVSISNTIMTKSGQVIEGIAILMLVYLTTSLITSALMNWYNARMRLVER